jgi:plastocyanin
LRRVRRLVLAIVCLLLGVTGSAAGHTGHGPVVVDVGEFAFSPERVTVYPGEPVFFVWRGPDTDHTVTADAGQPVTFESDPQGPPAHQPRDNWLLELSETGTFTYHCRIHPFMTGAVEVVAAPAQGGSPLSGVAAAVDRHRRLVLRWRLTRPVALRASVRRASGGRVVRSWDLAGAPDSHRRRLALGTLAAGRYRVTLAGVEAGSGTRIPAVRRTFTVA